MKLTIIYKLLLLLVKWFNLYPGTKIIYVKQAKTLMNRIKQGECLIEYYDMYRRRNGFFIGTMELESIKKLEITNERNDYTYRTINSDQLRKLCRNKFLKYKKRIKLLSIMIDYGY